MENKHTSLVEEIANSLTHGLGLLLGIAGIAFLILINMKNLEFWRMLGVSIFGLSVILTYTFSTLYHSLYFTKARTVFKKLDHASIYLLICGTYTPFLIFLKTRPAFVLLGCLYALTILGIAYKIIFINKLKRLQVIFFLALGWIGLLVLQPIFNTMPKFVILLLVAGGGFYSFGTIFYQWRSLKFNHGIWHLFVLFGTSCHLIALLYLSLPLR